MLGRLPRRHRGPLPLVKSSRADELVYVQAIRVILSQDAAAIQRELDLSIPALARGLRLDAIGDDLAAIFGRLRVAVAVGEQAARRAAVEMLERAQRKNATQTADQFSKAGLQVSPALGNEGWLREQQGIALAENVRLIQGVRGQRLEDVQGILLRGFQQGVDVKAMAKQIRERLHITKQRATLIAVDQSLKWSAALTRLRQQEAGVTDYIWQTAQDERVRPGHQALNKTKQKWSKRPVDNPVTGSVHHPGEAVRCRCIALPVFPGFEDEDEEGDE